MTPLLQSPALLLLAVGTLLGLNFPLGKLAQAAQMPAVLWAALISLGASTLLGAWLLLRRRPVVCDAQHARYFVITALVSYALPNLLVLAAMAHLGSGPTAMMFTLSPLFTALLSSLAGLRAPARLEYWASPSALAARCEAGRPAAWLWVGVGLLIPLLLALGNVYRSLDWPPRADGTWLAVGSHGVAALLLLALCALTGAWRGLPALAGVPWLAAAQVAAAVLMFPLFFRLQALGGPVLLSQIGTVGAGIGVAVGAGLLGERYPPLVWGGVALIALGIGLTVWARRGT